MWLDFFYAFLYVRLFSVLQNKNIFYSVEAK